MQSVWDGRSDQASESTLRRASASCAITWNLSAARSTSARKEQTLVKTADACASRSTSDLPRTN